VENIVIILTVILLSVMIIDYGLFRWNNRINNPDIIPGLRAWLLKTKLRGNLNLEEKVEVRRLIRKVYKNKYIIEIEDLEYELGVMDFAVYLEQGCELPLYEIISIMEELGKEPKTYNLCHGDLKIWVKHSYYYEKI